MQNTSEDGSFLNALEFMISQQQQQLSQSLQSQGNPPSNQNPMISNPNALMGNMVNQSLQQSNLMGPKRSENSFYQNVPMQQPQQSKPSRMNSNPMGQDPEALKALFAIPNVPTPPPAFSSQQQAIMQQQQQVAAMRQLMQQQQQQKQIPQQMQTMQNMQNTTADPSIQQAMGALLMNTNAPNQLGQQFSMAPNNNSELAMDWRMTMTQQERIQFIMRL
jgi:hypothetical protein